MPIWTELDSNPPPAGGIYNFFGTVRLTNSTLSGNSASGGNNLGGGVYNDSGTVQSRNTIIAQNTAATGPDVDGALTSQGHNLIGNTSGATVTAATGDLFDAAAAPLNLGPVANNGGPTQTMALLSGSVAIDAGDNCVTDVAHCSDANIPQLTSDQRGSGFPRQVDGNGDSTAVVDIGSVEAPNYPSFSIDDVFHLGRRSRLLPSIEAGGAADLPLHPGALRRLGDVAGRHRPARIDA